MTPEEEERAYWKARCKLAEAYIELSEVVGPVKASDFLRSLVPVPEAKNRGGRPRKDTPNRKGYNTAGNGKTRKAVLFEGEDTGGDERQRIQRRNREERENAAARVAILNERALMIAFLRHCGVPEDEISNRFSGPKAKADFFAIAERIESTK